jgi:cobalt-zinc-cadmium efflux system outer membrane protein
MNRCKYFLTVFLLYWFYYSPAQDSLRVSLPEADKIFLQKNLLLTAAQLNVDAQKAQEIQAKLYPNPQFTIGLNAYDADNKKLFYAGKNGEKSFEFDQLILLGGKRKNQVELARQNTKLAQLELEDLLRNLKFQLHTGLYSVYFDLQTVEKYDQQLQQLDSIITAYDQQVQKGNIALKELVRLKSAYISLNNDKAEIRQQIQSTQKDLQLLLHTSQFVLPRPEDLFTNRFENLLPLDSLQQLAIQHRSDLQSAALTKTIADLNIKYQKSLAKPDITLGTSYDQRGNAFANQYMFTVGLPLPFWNRNQGNIRSAEIQSKTAVVNQQYQQSVVAGEVMNAWYNLQRSIKDYQNTTRLYNSDFTTVLAGITANFLKRNISLLEYVDFMESHNASLAEVNRAKKQLATAAEMINYVVAYPVY